MKYIRLLRPHHYIKNLLVYAALLCSGQIMHKDLFLSATKGFAAFCAISSAVYILNDIKDAEKDRLHPTKKDRPIASGKVSTTHGWMLFTVLLAVAVAISPGYSKLYVLIYLAINIGYSLGLKNVPIADVVILSAGFILRVLYGGTITGISVSNWLWLTVLTFSLYLSLGKRRNELQSSGTNARAVLSRYPAEFLDKNMYMCLGLTNVFYALWSMEKAAAWTVPIVLIITLKYSLNVEGASDGDPVEVLLHDKALMALCIVYITALGIVIYA